MGTNSIVDNQKFTNMSSLNYFHFWAKKCNTLVKLTDGSLVISAVPFRLSDIFSSVLPNSNQCQDYPLNRVEVPSRSFNLMLYAVLPEVAVKIPVHAFNSLMLLGYLTKPLCTASQAWNIHSLFRCNPTIRLFLRRCEYFYNCQIAIPFFLSTISSSLRYGTAYPWLNPAVFQVWTFLIDISRGGCLYRVFKPIAQRSLIHLEFDHEVASFISNSCLFYYYLLEWYDICRDYTSWHV